MYMLLSFFIGVCVVVWVQNNTFLCPRCYEEGYRRRTDPILSIDSDYEIAKKLGDTRRCSKCGRRFKDSDF